jgi:SOS-response transcriptional repressor LexA
LGGVSNQAFALRIHGDSMKPEFSIGEVIIVDPAVMPRIGEYVVAKIETGNGENKKAFVKQPVRHKDQICLKPFNDKNQPMKITDAEIIGCVVSKIKEY